MGHEAGKRKEEETTDDNVRCSRQAGDWGRIVELELELDVWEGIAVSQHASKKAGDFRSSSCKNSLDVEPSSVEMAESPISVGRPAAPSWEHRPTKASVGLSPGPASSPNG